MELKELARNVYHILFSEKYEMASTFLRFQEHFESPKFRGKVFTLDEFVAWYIANSPESREVEKFTYYDEWVGFNVPSHVFIPFYEGQFDPLSERESALLRLLDDKRGSRFYVVATLPDAAPTSIRHELAHGLFYTDDSYRAEVMAVLLQIPHEVRNQINSFLRSSAGYHPDVWEDETHSYVMNNLEKLPNVGIEIESIRRVSVTLNKILDAHVSTS